MTAEDPPATPAQSTAAPAVPATPTAAADNRTTLETENFIESYQITAEWIRFADAKATVVLTVCGALASMLIPTIKPFLNRPELDHPWPWWPAVGVGLFGAWLLFTVCSAIWAFLCVQPFRRKGVHPALGKCSHFHAAAIAAAYSIDETDKYIRDCEELGMDGLKKEVIAGLLIDAHISDRKYSRVSRAIRLLAISALFGLLYTLVIQF